MADDSNQHGPVSRGRRFFKLAGMTASVAGRYATNRVKSAFQSADARDESSATAHRVMGERIARTLGELKGAAMKLGQMASIGADLLPAELASALRVLQKEAPPVSFAVIERMIEAELGAAPEVLFRRFEHEPFASASIGQVHRAQTDDGREVVVKVQYPGVDTSVDSDLAHLKLALKASGMLPKIKRRALDETFEEVRIHLHQELDYCNEADNVRMFRAHHAGDPYVVIPDVVGERSAQRVLTLTFEDGDDFDAIERKHYPQEVRDRIGENLYRITNSQVFDLRAIHADPNPANFAFREDGTVVLYDFGCVKVLKPEIVDAITRTLRTAILEDYDALDQALLDLGARVPGVPALGADFYKTWRDLFLQPFVSGGAFDYGRARIHEEVLRHVPGVMKRLDALQPAPEVVFLDRVIGGHYGNLRRIGSRGQFLDLVLPYLDLPPASALFGPSAA